MKTQASAAFLLLLFLSLPAFAQWSDQDRWYYDDLQRGGDLGQGVMKKFRISLSADPTMFVSGRITDQEPREQYSAVYPFGFGLNLSFEYNTVPFFATGSDLGFLYFPDSDDFQFTDVSFTPAFTITYNYTSMLLLPIHAFFKFRLPFGLPQDAWFTTDNPPEIAGFSLYFKPSFGLTYISNKVKVSVHEGIYNGTPYPSEELDYWAPQSLFSYRFSVGFEIAFRTRSSGFFELFYHGASAPKLVDQELYIDKSSPFGIFGFRGGFVLPF